MPAGSAWALARAALRPLRWLGGGSLIAGLAAAGLLSWPFDATPAAHVLTRARTGAESAAPAPAPGGQLAGLVPAVVPAAAALAPRRVEPIPVDATRPVDRRHGLIGQASYYASKFEGRRTASGERYRGGALTAAHRTLPFGTRVKVTSERTGRSVVVRINDRGPFHPRRVIDLSHTAASRLGILRRGRDDVRLQVLGRT